MNVSDDLDVLLGSTEGVSPDRAAIDRMWAVIDAATDEGGTDMAMIEEASTIEHLKRERYLWLVTAAAIAVVLGGIAIFVSRSSGTGDVGPVGEIETVEIDDNTPMVDTDDAKQVEEDSAEESQAGVSTLETVFGTFLADGAEAVFVTGLVDDAALDAPTSPIGGTWHEWFAWHEGADRDAVLTCVGEACLIEADTMLADVLGRPERYVIRAATDAGGVIQVLSFVETSEEETLSAYLAWAGAERPDLVADECMDEGWACVFAADAVADWAAGDDFVQELSPTPQADSLAPAGDR